MWVATRNRELQSYNYFFHHPDLSTEIKPLFFFSISPLNPIENDFYWRFFFGIKCVHLYHLKWFMKCLCKWAYRSVKVAHELCGFHWFRWGTLSMWKLKVDNGNNVLIFLVSCESRPVTNEALLRKLQHSIVKNLILNWLLFRLNSYSTPLLRLRHVHL